MNISLWITEIEISTVAIASLIVALAFYKSVNGYLRKLMIWYFLSQTFTWGASTINYLIQKDPQITQLVRMIVVIPMVVSMILILKYLRKIKT